MKKPRIAITMGDAAGIGPEIIVKALLIKKITRSCCPVVFGDLEILELVKKKLGCDIEFNAVKTLEDARYTKNLFDVVDFDNIDRGKFQTGSIDPMNGEAAYQYLKAACTAALEGFVDGIVTAPVHKEALWIAGHRYEGQTQILEELCKTDSSRMMLINQDLKIVLHSRHKPLKEAIDDIKKDSILETIVLVDKSFTEIGFDKPKIAVAGLNPHAGESGIFGNEEEREIRPAVIEAQSIGIKAFGPYPADTIFVRAKKGEFDVAIALYHDQGMIPIKMMGFSNPITYILGLPIIRTSVGHGTAFDIAWKNIADRGSMARAIEFAANLVRNSKRAK